MTTVEAEGIKFCKWCNNILYPAEKKDESGKPVLMYVCRYDAYQERAVNPCVYVNNVMHNVNELSLIISDVITDPTLPRAKQYCPECGHDEAVFFQAQTNRDDQGMELYFVCTNDSCMHRWRGIRNNSLDD